MQYNIKSHPTEYAGVVFRSRLEARWAAFFDLVEWKWQYEPIDLHGWTPDFRVTFPCGHSECDGEHVILVEVKPYFSIEEFAGHRCMDYPYGHKYRCEEFIPAHASAAFGNDPSVTYWEMGHGAGGGQESVENWIHRDIMEIWKKAGRIVQYRPQR